MAIKRRQDAYKESAVLKYIIMVAFMVAAILPSKSARAQTAPNGPTHMEPAAHVRAPGTAVPHQHRPVTFEGSGALVHGHDFHDDEAIYGELRFAPRTVPWFRLGIGLGMVGAIGEPHRRVGAIAGLSLIVETSLVELLGRSYLMYEVQANTEPNILIVRVEGQILLSDRFARRVTPIGRIVSDLVVPSEDAPTTTPRGTPLSVPAPACAPTERTPSPVSWPG